MGNNSAFTAFEHSVMSVAKRGKLDKALLSDLMRPYKDTDIDSGGKVGLFIKDRETGLNLEVEDVVIKVFTGKVFTPPKLPKDHMKWTDLQTAANESHNERVYEAFKKITRKFGWY